MSACKLADARSPRKPTTRSMTVARLGGEAAAVAKTPQRRNPASTVGWRSAARTQRQSYKLVACSGAASVVWGWAPRSYVRLGWMLLQMLHLGRIAKRNWSKSLVSDADLGNADSHALPEIPRV